MLRTGLLSTRPRTLAALALAVPGVPYGPFVCKNHFPFYLNMCIGLGAGFLFARQQSGHSDRSDLLHDPAALWTCVALALMVSSVAFSFSRGGVVSLIGGFGGPHPHLHI